MNDRDEATPTLKPVESSALSHVGHDGRARGTLYVRFSSGQVFAYHGVPVSAHADLLVALSIGAHFQRYIRGAYPFERVSDK